jgi:hypothetical protein
MVVKVDTVATADATMSTYARPGLSHPRCAREPLLLGAMSRNTVLNDKVELERFDITYGHSPLTVAIPKAVARLLNSCWVGRSLPLTTSTRKQVSKETTSRRARTNCQQRGAR